MRTIVARRPRGSHRSQAQVGGRLAKVAQLDAVLARELGQLRNVVETNRAGRSRGRARRDATLEQLLPVARKVSALRDDADERGVGS